MATADWESLRRQWEYSHADGALLQLLALIALIGVPLADTRIRRSVRRAGSSRMQGTVAVDLARPRGR